MSSRKLHVVVTDPACADISDILLYTEKQWDSLQRDDYSQRIGETLERLAVMPSIGRVHDNVSSFDMRSVPVGSHLLYDWVDGDRLVIARVLHARQDASAIDWNNLADEPNAEV